jgi:hypothetical protein
LAADPVRTLLVLGLIGALAACASPEEKQRRLDSAMVEQAKLDAQDEAEFLEDSAKLAASITLDTIVDLRELSNVGTDQYGDQFTYATYTAMARNLSRCFVDQTRFSTLVRGDTLSCQWEPQP